MHGRKPQDSRLEDMAKENRFNVPRGRRKTGTGFGMGCTGLFSCWCTNTHLVAIPPAGVALLCCLGLFVTVFESPVQQQQWRGEGEEDWAQWESRREIRMEGILLDPSQGSYRHIDSSRQETGFMGPPNPAGCLGFPVEQPIHGGHWLISELFQ